MTDPIADMLNQIKNAQAVSLETVELPFSNLRYEVAKILKDNDFVKEIEKKGRRPKKVLIVSLKESGISGLKKVSKPGQRMYLPYKKIGRVKGGYGIAIISTSKGLMTDKQVRKQKLGGEVFCEIW